MNFKHKELQEGKWHKLSLKEQMGNIGSEILRAARSEYKDKIMFEGAVERALELFDLTLEDPRWKGRRREIARTREVFCDATQGGSLYGSSLQDLQKYFDHFAFAARKNMM